MPPTYPQPLTAVELRLIVASSSKLPSTSSEITLDGKKWRLTEPLDISSPATLPKYVCVSYIWGEGRAPNLFDPKRLMSSQTIPALQAAMLAAKDSEELGYWIDAISVPAEEESWVRRQATLESMGFIYSRASEVIVTLSENTYGVIEQAVRLGVLDEDAMKVLEQDSWVASCWTYQEVVNSQQTRLVSLKQQSATALSIDLMQFMNCVGNSTTQYGKRHNIDTFKITSIFPRLSAFEDTVADWLTADFLERSALQVMANIARRFCRPTEPQNYFLSMMGALTKDPCWDTEEDILAELSERVMALCERKNDYSFIYSSAPRDVRPGKRWRPQPGPLKPLLAWHCYGESAEGFFNSDGFWLCDMAHVQPTNVLSEDGKLWIGKHFARGLDVTNESTETIANLTFNKLTSIGFTGSDQYIILPDGLYFPQTPLPMDSNATILISGNIKWPIGAPGLALYHDDGQKLIGCIPGVYVRPFQEVMSSTVLIDSLAAVTAEKPPT
jgi:hypothetical protein